MHDTQVTWADESIDLTETQLAQWRCRTEQLDGSFWIQYTEGPCPRCEAMTQAYTTNKPGPFEGAFAEAEETVGKLQVAVPVDCNCGFAHGEKDATGCGRDWVVTCEVATKDVSDG